MRRPRRRCSPARRGRAGGRASPFDAILATADVATAIRRPRAAVRAPARRVCGRAAGCAAQLPAARATLADVEAAVAKRRLPRRCAAAPGPWSFATSPTRRRDGCGRPASRTSGRGFSTGPSSRRTRSDAHRHGDRSARTSTRQTLSEDRDASRGRGPRAHGRPGAHALRAVEHPSRAPRCAHCLARRCPAAPQRRCEGAGDSAHGPTTSRSTAARADAPSARPTRCCSDALLDDADSSRCSTTNPSSRCARRMLRL